MSFEPRWNCCRLMVGERKGKTNFSRRLEKLVLRFTSLMTGSNYQWLSAWELHRTERHGVQRCRWLWPSTHRNEEEPVQSSPLPWWCETCRWSDSSFEWKNVTYSDQFDLTDPDPMTLVLGLGVRAKICGLGIGKVIGLGLRIRPWHKSSRPLIWLIPAISCQTQRISCHCHFCQSQNW